MILKWAGGKKWLYKNHAELFSFNDEGTYIEPFLGGGSIFFSLKPNKALLSDINPKLIDLFKALKNNPADLYTKVESLISTHSENQYYEIRGEFNSLKSYPEYFLYLNRTCFNGIYRENMKGEFNVPIGKRNSSYFPFTLEDFQKYSKILTNVEIKNQGFEASLQQAKKGDFIYIDPPYLKKENDYESFNKYGDKIFTPDDLERLAEILESLSGECKILISNFDIDNVKKLFPNWNQKSVKQMSYLSGSAKGRKEMEEVLIYNY